MPIFEPVKRPDPIKPDTSLDEELQKSGDEANLTLYFVKIVVISASDLINADVGLIGDLSDPYCEVTVGDITSKTQTIQNDLNPVWNERMNFFVPQKPEKITFRVLDENVHTKDDFLGSVDFDCGHLFEIDGEFNGDLKIAINGKEKGSIRFKLNWSTIKPVETEIKLAYAEKELDCQKNEIQASLKTLDESEELRKTVIGELTEKEKEIIQKAEELDKEQERYQTELSSKEQQLLDKAQEIETKTKEKEEAEVARRESVSVTKDIKMKLAEVEKKLSQQAKELEEKRNLYTEAVEMKTKEINETLTKKEQEIVRLSKTIQEKEDAVSNAQLKKDETQAELDTLKKKFSSLEGNIATLKAALTEAKKRQSVNASMTAKEKDIAVTNDTTQSELNKVQTELDKVKKENIRLESELKNAKILLEKEKEQTRKQQQQQQQQQNNEVAPGTGVCCGLC